MRQTFIELYTYKDAWKDKSREERMSVIEGIMHAIRGLEQAGVEVIGFGPNDPATDRRAPFDFYCVYSVPSAEFQQTFEAEVAKSGWYDLFDQVNVSGPAYSALGGLLQHVAGEMPGPQPEAILAEMPFTKKKIEVLGDSLAYVDEGGGSPVVFLHGDMMSSYLWRNVLPHVLPGRRCIALDLIGMGDSAKRAETGSDAYALAVHQRYLDAFLEEIGLGDGIVFVGHDWGANLAFDWAMRNPDRVAGLAFSEAITPPFTWKTWPAEVHDLFELVRSPDGAQILIETNFFVEGAQNGILRKLSEAEKAEYRRPFLVPGEGRRPTHSWPASVPLDGEPSDVARQIERQVAFMATTDIPKLFLNAEPGSVTTGERRERIRVWPRLSEATSAGLHWPPEDSPHQIGRAIHAWLAAEIEGEKS